MGPVPPGVRLIARAAAPAVSVPLELLRFSTAGSVDGGKSTLIGRLLYDTHRVCEDRLDAVERATRRRGEEGINLALLSDGLRSDREHNITIDVAHHYFATTRRTFVITDTPGHVQYTRNMVTGASSADVAVVLVDAQTGMLTQSRRHLFIAALLRVAHVMVAVNKMDLLGSRQDEYHRICRECRVYAERLRIADVRFVPISALHGDNVVARSAAMPWYSGPTLLEYLERVEAGRHVDSRGFRFPVQYVISTHGCRGLAGRVASGSVSPGDEVLVLPSGHAARVRAIAVADRAVDEAVSGDSVVITLDEDLDVGRGDMLTRRPNQPQVGTRLDAALCWFDARPLVTDVPYEVQQTTRSVRARVTRLVHTVDVDTLAHENAATLQCNDIGLVEITTGEPICFDPYARDRATGSFILVNPFTHATVAAGMIYGRAEPPAIVSVRTATPAAEPTVPRATRIHRGEREAQNGHAAAVLWFTGLSGSGKTTLAHALERRLFAAGCRTMLLDGDALRAGLCRDLRFSAADRSENVRRAGEVARIGFDHGLLVICAFISPYARDRADVRALFPKGRFVEVFVDCPVEECARRDPKGLYARARAGTLARMTGLDDPFEPPVAADVVVRTERQTVEAIVTVLVANLVHRGLVRDGFSTPAATS